MQINKKKYIFVFIITVVLFISVFLVVSLFNKEKRANISELQRKITVDLIANETQFDLLKNAPCKAIESDSLLSRQMGELGKKLAYAEEKQGENNNDVIELKKYYSLLEVKDYLLSQEVANKCDIQIESIIYFYDHNCDDCSKQGLVLTELKRKYPWLRIYSFDRDLDFSIVETFAGLYDLSENAPIIIIGNEKYVGFKTISEIEEYIPELLIKKERADVKDGAIKFLLKNDKLDAIKNDFNFVSYIKDELVYSYTTLNKEGDEEVKEVVLIFNSDKEEFSIKDTDL